MPHTRFPKISALVLSLALPLAALPAVAQNAPAAPAADAGKTDAAPAVPPTGFNPGTDVGQNETGPGSTYTLDGDYGDWQIRCVRTKDGFDPCQLYQLLKDDKNNPVAEFSLVALPQGSEATAGATVVTPLETLLTRDLMLAVDGAKAKRYPFTWCSQVGCFARIGFTDAELATLKKGVKATVEIVPMVAPNQTVDLTVSLKGFTAGYDKMKSTNDATQARADAAQKANGGASGGTGSGGTGSGNAGTSGGTDSSGTKSGN